VVETLCFAFPFFYKIPDHGRTLLRALPIDLSGRVQDADVLCPLDQRKHAMKSCQACLCRDMECA
jgi:hypothetical protein